MASYSDNVHAEMLERRIEMMQRWHYGFSSIDYPRMMTSLCADYTNLLKALHKKQVPVTVGALEALSQRPQELVVLLMKNMELLATAQASLIFPALVATVHISNVIVHPDVRGKGYGAAVMNGLCGLAAQKWRVKPALVFQLTSQEKRGTKDFYQKLGFVPTPTIRYTNTVQD